MIVCWGIKTNCPSDINPYRKDSAIISAKDDVIYVFGGVPATESAEKAEEIIVKEDCPILVFKLIITPNAVNMSLKWSLVKNQTGDAPLQVYGAAVALHTKSTKSKIIYLYGGICSRGLDPYIYSLELTSLKWTKHVDMVVDETLDRMPVGRYGHTMCCYDGHLVIFGGYSGSDQYNISISNALYFVNLKTKTWHKVTGDIISNPFPAMRARHSACIIGEEMFVFGGAVLHHPTSEISDPTVCWVKVADDSCVWVLNLKTQIWRWAEGSKRCSNEKKTHPSARQNHRAVICSDKMYVYGGEVLGFNTQTEPNGISQYESLTLVNELWEYTPKWDRWVLITFSLFEPPPRCLGGIEVYGSYLMIFNGFYTNVTESECDLKNQDDDLTTAFFVDFNPSMAFITRLRYSAKLRNGQDLDEFAVTPDERAIIKSLVVLTKFASKSYLTQSIP